MVTVIYSNGYSDIKQWLLQNKEKVTVTK